MTWWMKEGTKTTKPILLLTTSIHVYLCPTAGIISITVSEHILIPSHIVLNYRNLEDKNKTLNK